MALVLIVLAVIGLAILSQFFGHDSRETVGSKEQEFASYGMTWDTPGYQQELADELAGALQKNQVPPTEPKQERPAGSIRESPPQPLDILPSTGR